PERDSRVIDYVIFGSQLDDVSYGRSTDGGNEWITFSQSTPGISNLFSSAASPEFQEQPIQVYPNPVSQGMVFFNRAVSVQLFDLSGRMLGEKTNTSELYVGNMPAGIYLLKFPGGQVDKILIQE
ncbi:MAG: T9SS type A sorting domain-containing protein, partial [Bacteroidales bacterium]|nr:T9SS type A sorting domain-containing protein [Bacteroidales bacterium]